jgi:hypothetical protein
MPQEKRYNKIKTESKMLMNVIKMICNRAKSSVASLLAPIWQIPIKKKGWLLNRLYNPMPI